MGYVDPGVYSTVVDESEYAVVGGGTVLAVVGTSIKGNVNEVIDCYGEQDLIDKIGVPLAALPDQAVLAAIQFMKRGSHVKFVRISETAAPASEATKTVKDYPANAVDTLTFDAVSPGTWGNDLVCGIEVPGSDYYTETIGVGVIATLVYQTLAPGLNITKLSNVPVLPGSVSMSVTMATGVVETFTDNSAGALTGGAHGGTINYVTGDMEITFIVTNPLVGGDMVVTYRKVTNFITVAAPAATFLPAFDLQPNPLIINLNTWKIAPGSVRALEGAGMTMDNTTGLGVDNGAGIFVVAGNVAAGTINYDTGVLNISFTAGLTAGVTIIFREPYFNVYVEAPVDRHGTLGEVERFNALVMDIGSPRYAITVINEGVRGEIAKSNLITATDEIAPAIIAIPMAGANALAGGADGLAGVVPADYIGAYVGGVATGLQLFSSVENQEFDMLAVPGISDAGVVNAGIAICDARKEDIFLVDPPFASTVETLIAWHNGIGFSHNAFNSRYACLMGFWQKITDPYTRTDIWLPPSGFVAASMAYNDSVSYPWNAPAGKTRGVLLNVIESEYSPSRPQRVAMYDFPNAINSIVNFNNAGAVIWGQKTLYRINSALNRLNVVRMLCYIERVIRKSVDSLTFEQNNEFLWARFKSIVTPFIENIRATGGLDSYTIVCDASTNPGWVRQQKEMRARIELTPTDTAEKIVLQYIINKPA